MIVVGCPNEVHLDGTSVALVSRTDRDHLIIKCNWTTREFLIKCVGSRWIGELSGCDQGWSVRGLFLFKYKLESGFRLSGAGNMRSN